MKREQILWGKHPAYAGGVWIKLTDDTSKAEVRRRAAQGFVLAIMDKGERPS